MLLKLIIIFLFIFIFFYLRNFLKLNRKQKVLKAKKFTTFNKKNLNNWMNLTKKERYKLSKQDSVKYMDNQPVIDLICTKQTGLLPLLDEEVRVPNGSDKNFQSKFLKSNPNNLFLRPARSYNGPFTILHFAGPVACR